MKPLVLTLVTAICFLVLSPAGRLAAETDPSGEYRIVEGSRPDGTGKYRGNVTVEKAGSAAFTVNWALESGEKYHGPALFVNGVLGAGYGEGLTGLVVYEIKGRTLKAKWLLSATPQTVGEYELSGPGTLNGLYKFTNGLAGGVTFKPNGKVYDVVFNLATGSVPGIAVRVGDVLIAASGNPGAKNYGLAAYHAAGNKVEGVWAVPGQNGLGIENLGPGGSDQAPAETVVTAPATGGGAVGFNAAGTEVRFAGDTYQLKDSQSAPGRPTSELREYLRAGETFDQYPKMFALRVQEGAGSDPLTFTRAVLATVKKDSPSAMTNEIIHDENSATMEFMLVNGDDAEYNFWHYFRLPQGRLGSVQFVLRNKAPYETRDKFKAERKAHFEDWVKDAKALASQVPGALAKTTKAPTGGQTAGAPPKPAEQKPEMSNDELAEKISVDMKKAGGIGFNFLNLLKDGKLPEAAALVANEGLAKAGTTRPEFLAKLQQAQAADGRVLSFVPVKDKSDFGAEPGGGIYIVLVADSKCEKTPSARETMRFLRFPDGQVKMVNYQRSR